MWFRFASGMAKKKKSQSLTERINGLANAIGAKAPPDLGTIKGELIQLGVLVEALEEGAIIGDAETKIESLEAELENLKTEVEAFRAERKKQEQEKKREDIPDIQSEILKRLPSQSEGWLKIDEISQTVGIPIDETEVHLYRLRKAGLAIGRTTYGRSLWRRTIRGSEMVVAKRLAGEEDEKKAYKHADLPKEQHEALAMIGSDPEGANENAIAERIGASLMLTQRYLRKLREAEMATDGDEPQATYGTGQIWWLKEKGEDYLAERDLL